MIRDITSASFETEVLAASHARPIAVAFWAPWNEGSEVMDLPLEQVAVATQGIGRVVRVNADEQPGLATAHGINTLPTLLFFRHGLAYDRILGVTSKELVLTRILEEADVLADSQLAVAV